MSTINNLFSICGSSTTKFLFNRMERMIQLRDIFMPQHKKMRLLDFQNVKEHSRVELRLFSADKIVDILSNTLEKFTRTGRTGGYLGMIKFVVEQIFQCRVVSWVRAWSSQRPLNSFALLSWILLAVGSPKRWYRVWDSCFAAPRRSVR